MPCNRDLFNGANDKKGIGGGFALFEHHQFTSSVN